jgi:hypothetical protein
LGGLFRKFPPLANILMAAVGESFFDIAAFCEKRKAQLLLDATGSRGGSSARANFEVHFADGSRP